MFEYLSLETYIVSSNALIFDETKKWDTSGIFALIYTPFSVPWIGVNVIVASWAFKSFLVIYDSIEGAVDFIVTTFVSVS